MPNLKLTITTPERIIFDDTIDQISLPTTTGEITVLPHHIPLISLLQPGEARIIKGAEEIVMAVSGGFIEVQPQHVTVLADTAERGEEIDEDRAETARKKAEQLLLEKKADSVDYAALQVKLEKEMARLRVVRRHRYRRGGSSPIS
ncbi:MAG: ATP synthase F1 subunit epsilon [Patescibacteria group bacterium]